MNYTRESARVQRTPYRLARGWQTSRQGTNITLLCKRVRPLGKHGHLASLRSRDWFDSYEDALTSSMGIGKPCLCFDVRAFHFTSRVLVQCLGYVEVTTSTAQIPAL